MILRSATHATVVHAMPAAETDPATGFYQVRPTARIDAARIELSWDSVSEATMMAVRQHYAQFGQRGIPFEYGPPTDNLPDQWYQYDEPLSIQRTTSRRISMRTAVRQTLARD